LILGDRGQPILSRGLGDFPVISGSRVRPVRESDVKVPSDMYALGDAPVDYWYDLQWTMGEFGYFAVNDRALKYIAHPHVFNMAFVDGHVESVKTNNLTFPWGAHEAYLRRWNNDHEP
jgi:prepilin-type processing-associated H-X9-DG protein